MTLKTKLYASLLIGSLISSAALAQEPAADPAEKLICKKQLETGSLVKKRKTCMTKAQWEKVAHSQNDGTRKLVDQLSGSCGQGETGCGF